MVVQGVDIAFLIEAHGIYSVGPDRAMTNSVRKKTQGTSSQGLQEEKALDRCPYI